MAGAPRRRPGALVAVLFVVSATALLGATRAEAVSFSGPTSFAAGAQPRSVAMGDFNGDSDPDLAVANEEFGRVSILLGAAGATFSPRTEFNAGSNPPSVAVGEFNGDSDPDLVLANAGTSSVSILLGAAGGTFSAPSSFGAGVAPRAVAVGEFNGDGNADLAVANLFGADVSILLGAGDGTFTGPTEFDVGDAPVSVAVGEFNGDSDADLAVVNAASDNVSILLGAAGGTFTAPTDFDAGSNPASVAVGEFNGDGDADLAVATRLTANVSVLLGAGDGAFAAPTSFGAGDGVASVAVGEFNGDANPDLAVANSLSANVSVLVGAADGTFGAPTSFGAGNGPQSVTVGEWNGDSHPDLAVANRYSGDVSILVGQAEPTLHTRATGATIGAPIHDTATVAGGESPTGEITFELYGPGDANCSGPAVFTHTVPVDAGNGDYDSVDFTPTAAGVYNWTATYSGDETNAAASSPCGAAGETSVVKPASPALSTNASGDVALGGTIHDTAQLSGGSSPGGTITFDLYGPGDANCTGAPAFTDTKTVSGNASYVSANFTPTQAGTYRWIASYSGDGDNEAISGSCNDPNENVTVPASPPPPDPRQTPAIEVTGLERDRENGSATLTVATNGAGHLSIDRTNKVKGAGPATLDEAGSAELEVVLRNKAAKTLARKGKLTVNPKILLIAPGGATILLRHRFALRRN